MKRSIVLGIFLFLVNTCVQPKVFLIYGGKTGWIGQKIMVAVRDSGHQAVAGEARIENREQVEKEIIAVKPDFIINAAGVVGKPNVDWCEMHKPETIRHNIIGALNVADLSYVHKIHMTNIGTGCLYDYDEQHPMYSGIGFKEEDIPNLYGAFYCKTKIFLEQYFEAYPNVLNLRVRLPIAGDLYRGNLILKLTKYPKVVNIPNSITVLDDMVPLIPEMALRGLTGNYNFVNPGTISHNELLDLYTEYVDPSFSYENFSLAEQSKVLRAPRGYNELDVTKILKIFPHIPHVKLSAVQVMQKIKKQINIS